MALNQDITKVIRVLETFAGIGAQHKAITNTKLPFEISQTSEWDARAIIAYALIHNKSKFIKKENEISKWSDAKIKEYFNNKIFSLDSKKPGNVSGKFKEFKIALIAANEVNNNWSNIMTFPGKRLTGINLVTYSFPCQGLSIANMGRDTGIDKNSSSTSNLIWEIKRILDEAEKEKILLPKYLLMENVKNLISKKYKNDFDGWKKILQAKGYTTFTFVLNGLDHNSLQKRIRVFALSIKKEFVPSSWQSDEIVKEVIDNNYSRKLSVMKREKEYFKILSSSNVFKDEIIDARVNDTPSRRRMRDENKDLISYAKNRKYIFNTLTTKQDRHPNLGMIKTDDIMAGKLNARFITNREAYQIMGFKSKDYANIKPYYTKNIITKDSMYRQAGNSIVVQVLEDIFKFISDIERGVYED